MQGDLRSKLWTKACRLIEKERERERGGERETGPIQPGPGCEAFTWACSFWSCCLASCSSLCSCWLRLRSPWSSCWLSCSSLCRPHSLCSWTSSYPTTIEGRAQRKRKSIHYKESLSPLAWTGAPAHSNQPSSGPYHIHTEQRNSSTIHIHPDTPDRLEQPCAECRNKNQCFLTKCEIAAHCSTENVKRRSKNDLYFRWWIFVIMLFSHYSHWAVCDTTNCMTIIYYFTTGYFSNR